MASQSYREILKRAGVVLVIVGLADIARMIYCIIHKISYSSSLNLFAVIGGILLMRGSLRTAATIRWFGVFFLSAGIAMLFAWPTVQPIDLTLTQIRLNPEGFVGGAVFVVFVLGLFFWVITELGRAPVQAASDAAGVKRRNMRISAATGVALVVGLAVSLHFFLGGDSAERAISMAEKQVGPGYKWYVHSLSYTGTGGSTSVSGVVTAWNETEIREIPVHWESRD